MTEPLVRAGPLANQSLHPAQALWDTGTEPWHLYSALGTYHDKFCWVGPINLWTDWVIRFNIIFSYGTTIYCNIGQSLKVRFWILSDMGTYLCVMCKKQVTMWKYMCHMLGLGFWWQKEGSFIFIYVSVGIFQGNANSAWQMWHQRRGNTWVRSRHMCRSLKWQKGHAEEWE